MCIRDSLCTLIFSALNIVAEDIQISLAPLPDPFMGREPYYLTLKDDNNSLSRVLSNGMISTKGLAPIYFSVVVTNNSNREIEFPYPFKSASGYNMLSFEVIKEDKAKLLIKKKWQVHAPLDNKEIDKLGWGTIPPKSSIVIPVVFSDIIWDNINELNKLKYDKNNAMIIALIKVEGFCNLRSEPVKISWVLLDDWYNGIKPLTNEIGQPHELPK